jgi:DNA polymerase-3 subunit alpha
VLEALIKAGAFDSTGATRKGMLAVLEQALALGAKTQADKAAGQFDLFGDMGGGDSEDETTGMAKDYAPIPTEEYSKIEKLDLEREATGLYMSGHPLDESREAVESRIEHTIASLPNLPDQTQVRIGGMVTAYRALVTKRGDPMAFVQIEGTDMASVRVVVLPKVFEQARQHLQHDRAVVILTGKLETKEGRCDILAERVMPLSEAPQLTAITIKANEEQLETESTIHELKRILRNYNGDATVDVQVFTRHGERTMRLGSEWKVALESGLMEELRELLGPTCV